MQQTDIVELFSRPPVVVGGVGGSGTRVIAAVLERSGVFIGRELNESADNMTIARKFPEIRDGILDGCSDDRTFIDFVESVFDQFKSQMMDQLAGSTGDYQRWGWKIPANYMLLGYLDKIFPGLRYIHVVRHGLDMAFSSNQNQLNNWVRFFNIEQSFGPLPKRSLEFWIRANEFAIHTGTKLLLDRFLLLNFDQVCKQSEELFSLLSEFIPGINLDVEFISSYVGTPGSIGRHKQQDLTQFTPNQLDSVRKLGFEARCNDSK